MAADCIAPWSCVYQPGAVPIHSLGQGHSAPAGNADTGRTGFATQPQLAVRMIERAIGTGMPFSRVAADTEYGVGDVECALRQAGKGYVLGVASSHWFGSRKRAIGGTAEEIAKAVLPAAW